ncbi:hypothetical protein GDO81_021032 [Engystomops pustulosus]|uniref:Uncharacterized protein n=1 Tax=Engystomops pustulosus TaxID=76066 RepID=A0AAV6ZD88_ENGPU|nr:hypothetical protein GDO81_021032 [Engystomops pustulosus]
MIVITGMGVEEVASRGHLQNVTSTPATTSHYPENNSTTVTVNQTETSTTQPYTTRSTTTEEHSTTRGYTSTSHPGGSMSNLTTTSSIITSQVSNRTTTLVTNRTQGQTETPENMTRNSTIGGTTTSALEVTTEEMEDFTSLYTSTSSQEGSGDYSDYSTTNKAINVTEMSTSHSTGAVEQSTVSPNASSESSSSYPETNTTVTSTTNQQYTTHNDTTEEMSTAIPYTSTSYPESSTSNLTTATTLPGITKSKNPTQDTTLHPANTTNGENTTSALEETTENMEEFSSLYTSTTFLESSGDRPDFSTTNEAINTTKVTTTLRQYTSHVTTLAPESTTPNSTIGESTTFVVEVTTEDIEDSLSPSTRIPESSEGFPGYGTTNEAISRTEETTTLHERTLHSTTTAEGTGMTPSTSTSPPESTMSNMTTNNTTSSLGYTTEDSTVSTENIAPNSTITDNSTSALEVTTEDSEDLNTLYTSSGDYSTTNETISMTEERTTLHQPASYKSTSEGSAVTHYTSTFHPESSTNFSSPGVATRDVTLAPENTIAISSTGVYVTSALEETTEDSEELKTQYTSITATGSSGDQADYSTTKEAINITEVTTTTHPHVLHSVTTTGVPTSPYTLHPGSSMSYRTTTASLPGNTPEDYTFSPENTSSTTGGNTTSDQEVTTHDMDGYVSLYTSTTLPQSSGDNPDYGTTNEAINTTEKTTTLQQYTSHSTTTGEGSSAESSTSHISSSMRELTTTIVPPPEITTDVSEFLTTTHQTHDNNLATENLISNTGENPTSHNEETTEYIQDFVSLYTSTTFPQSSGASPEFSTTNEAISMTEVSTTLQPYTYHHTARGEGFSTTVYSSNTNPTATSLAGDTMEDNTLITENITPNYTNGENITSADIEGHRSLHTSTRIPETSRDSPDSSTTNGAINVTEVTTTLQQYTSHGTTSAEGSTSPYTPTSYVGDSMSHLTTTSSPGISTHFSDFYSSALVTNETQDTLAPESATPKPSSRGASISTTENMEDFMSLYTSIFPESSSHSENTSTTMGIKKTETSTAPQQDTSHDNPTEESPMSSTSKAGP